MVAAGLGLVWAGYTVGLYGWLLVSGYDVSFRDLFYTSWAPGPAGPSAGKGPPPGYITKGNQGVTTPPRPGKAG